MIFVRINSPTNSFLIYIIIWSVPGLNRGVTYSRSNLTPETLTTPIVQSEESGIACIGRK